MDAVALAEADAVSVPVAVSEDVMEEVAVWLELPLPVGDDEAVSD